MSVSRTKRELSQAESLTLLRGAENTGHVSVSVRALPVVIPVSFALEDGAVVVSGGAFDEFSLVRVGDVVAFQADGKDSQGRWSVLVRGRAELASVNGVVAVRIPAEIVDGQRF